MAHTLESLADDIRRMGIRRGDVLMVHSSLKSIGWVEGGADTVIDAFLSVIGVPKRGEGAPHPDGSGLKAPRWGTPDGVMFVPTLTATFAASPWTNLNKHAFDPKETPSRVGKITDVFWRRPEAYRSEHPTHSLAAIGRSARELVKGHGGDASTFDKHGPYGKYVRLGAKVCFIGTSLRCNTTLHVTEDWAGLPYMDQNSKALVKQGGKEIVVPLRNSPNGHRSFYASDDESPAAKLFYGLGLVTEAKLGDARVQLIAAQDIVNTMMRTFHDGEPGFLLCKSRDCEFCRKGREACERELPRIRRTVEQLAADGWCRIQEATGEARVSC